MKNKLCLHGIDIKHQAQLLSLIKKVLSGSVVKYKVKEKYFNDSDMYKCRIAYFAAKDLTAVKIKCAWGILSVGDKLFPIADIIFTFDSKNKTSIVIMERLLRCILGSKLKFILEEPDYQQRIDQLKGAYCINEEKNYNAKQAVSAIYCHLPWQIYGISKLWHDILLRGTERTLLRQMRVKLRRLRSTLVLLKPLLPKDSIKYWQEVLKNRTNFLSEARECDVALIICMKINMRGSKVQDTVPVLTDILQKMRQQASVEIMKKLRLNSLTLELSIFLLWLFKAAAEQNKNIALEEFFKQRFHDWYNKILFLPEKYSDTSNMEQLHKIRIKLKRFRYALQSIPEITASQQLLRSLKHLQDVLGLLHDDYVNSNLLQTIQEKYPQFPQLQCETALFRGWEQAKVDAALENLPSQCEDFFIILREWHTEYL